MLPIPTSPKLSHGGCNLYLSLFFTNFDCGQCLLGRKSRRFDDDCLRSEGFRRCVLCCGGVPDTETRMIGFLIVRHTRLEIHTSSAPSQNKARIHVHGSSWAVMRGCALSSMFRLKREKDAQHLLPFVGERSLVSAQALLKK